MPEPRSRVRLTSPTPGLAQGDDFGHESVTEGPNGAGGGGGGRVGGWGGGGALALIDLTGDVDAILARARIKPVPIGQVALRNLLDEDEGLVARWNQHAATLMPHGSPIVVQRLLQRLSDLCEVQNQTASSASNDNGNDNDENNINDAPKPGRWSRRFPAARSLLEARMLWALSRVESPLALDVLLNQPALWRSALGRDEAPDEEVERTLNAHAEDDRHRRLARLLRAPTIAAAGWANIGKSSLLNALSGREVSLVADIAGTTRDHVGAAIVLDGLMVRWLDLPGLNLAGDHQDPIASEAETIALAATRHADLVLSCASALTDKAAAHAHAAPPDPSRLGVPANRVKRIALRSDLGPASFAHDMSVSVRDPESVRALASACRAWLVRDEDLRWASTVGPWRFWEAAT